MNAVAMSNPVRRSTPGRARKSRIVLAGLALLAAVGIVGLRLATRPGSSTAVVAKGQHYVPVPADPAIEKAWGIRFTGLILAADGGALDVRYQVTDAAKSGRIHGGSVSNPNPATAIKNLPVFIREAGGGAILPTSAMMHFEHFHFQTEAVGNTYSILYGNSGGLLHVGDMVTIWMADGLKLHHVVVSS
jgi:hypothetical protein